MEPIVYDTVMTANSTGHWPCHERYAEKRIILKTAHTNTYCELRYEKEKFFQTTQKTNEIVCLTCVGCTTSLASCCESCFCRAHF